MPLATHGSTFAVGLHLMHALFLLTFLPLVFCMKDTLRSESLQGAGAVVDTASGPVQGVIQRSHGNNVESFKGMPFAAPPVGKNRWRSPQPVTKWTDVRKASAFGDACVQKNNIMTELYPVKISEDCLYLNVYRPANATSGENLPVMLFFHGGSYVLGASSFFIYDAAERVATAPERVIIVTANYRLQAFGYLGGELMRSELYPGSQQKTTGNWGFLDQRAAMRWVNENIGNFGGDPGALTIFGESAGAGSVSAHLVSEGSWPLFSQAIVESGPAFATWTGQTESHAEAGLASVIASVGCQGKSDSETLDCLRSVEFQNISAAGRQAASTPGGVGMIRWCPTADGVVLTGQPRDLLMAGKVNKTHKVLLGTNKDEGSVFVKPKGSKMTEQGYLDFMTKHFGETLGEEIVQRYPSANYSSPFWAAVDAFGDVAMTCPARETARLLSKAGLKVFRYFFVHECEALKLLGKHDNIGVFHGSDLIYVFDLSISTFGKAEHELASNFGRWWTTFAKSGYPASAAEWPAFTPDSGKHLTIDAGDDSRVSSGLKSELCDWWLEGHYPDLMALPVQGSDLLAEVATELKSRAEAVPVW